MNTAFKAFLVGTGALAVTGMMLTITLLVSDVEYHPFMIVNSVLGCYGIGSTVAYYLIRQSAQLKSALAEAEGLHEKLADAHEKLQRHARLDIMTGMLNREAFFKQVEQAKLDDRGGNATMLIVDIDHFKQINDTWGHLEGDKAIMQVANTICDIAPEGAIAGRIGGEEFAMFIEQNIGIGGTTIAEAIREAISDLHFFPDGSDVRQPLSVSIGGAKGANNGVTTDLVRRADRTLYKAKDAGRNCVRFEAAA